MRLAYNKPAKSIKADKTMKARLARPRWLGLYIFRSPRTGKTIASNAPPTAPPTCPARLIPGIKTLPTRLMTKRER